MATATTTTTPTPATASSSPSPSPGTNSRAAIKPYTLVIPIDHVNKRIFLSKKARGSGKGKWIGFGGKVEPGESIDDGAVREMKEESGLSLDIAQMHKAGLLMFTFQDSTSFNLPARAEIHVYTIEVDHFDHHQLTVNDEFCAPGQWFSRSDIPLCEMWPDFADWYPNLFDRKRFRARIHYVDNHKPITRFIDVVNDATDNLLAPSDWE